MKRVQGYKHPVATAVAFSLALLGAASALAGPVERAQAKRMHDRLAGVPASEAVLDQMESLIV